MPVGGSATVSPERAKAVLAGAAPQTDGEVEVGRLRVLSGWMLLDGSTNPVLRQRRETLVRGLVVGLAGSGVPLSTPAKEDQR